MYHSGNEVIDIINCKIGLKYENYLVSNTGLQGKNCRLPLC